MRVFPVIEGLEELEKEKKWEEARVILYDLWSADKDNLDFFMRLSSECWFLVAEWEVEKNGWPGLGSFPGHPHRMHDIWERGTPFL